MGEPGIAPKIIGRELNKLYNAMKVLLTCEAPNGLRWIIERARAADHWQTPVVALPSALYEYSASSEKSVANQYIRMGDCSPLRRQLISTRSALER